jgi:glycine cleavage system H protein
VLFQFVRVGTRIACLLDQDVVETVEAVMSFLFLAAMLILVLAVQLIIALVRRRGSDLAAQPAAQAPEPLPQPIAPPGTFIAPAHSWVRFDVDGAFKVGIDELLAGALGAVDEIDLPGPGMRVERGDPLVGLRIGDKRLSVPAPVSGEIVTRNPQALSAPGQVTRDPYGLGWLVRLQPIDHKQALEPLHIGRGATGYLKREYRRLVELVSASISPQAAHMADGGYLEKGALAQLSPAAFEAFEQQFLH